MLLVGDVRCIPDISNLVILNLSSLVEGFPRVFLTPSVSASYNNDKEFDIAYANYIFSNDYAFMEFMKIVYNLYMGLDVFLIVSRGDIYDTVTESLCKLIQQRYGYNSQFINEIADINYYDDSSFSVYGLSNLDQDKERMSYLAVQTDPNILKLFDDE